MTGTTITFIRNQHPLISNPLKPSLSTDFAFLSNICKCFNFHMFICSVGRADVCLLRSKRVSTHSLRDKGTKGQRDKGTKGQRDKETKGQRDKWTKGKREKRDI